ncbi:Predicted ribosomal protein [Listeria grayi]|uniref:Ribosomal processing cysteine protease Prp n=1 Tax=Listeria grayi FSL F6-1183 TaxID=1265827 RepID=A0A829R9V1_LISGR|nr:ribosomal-processing cysteine protease Prp [Listeria grayi]EUJ29827.1 hypothetical protein LMUR_01932 [Listeria grayi FSL F6-1183]MBC1920743.1 ribosomal-processing cysteine protease Prp [Listeria grayi]VEI34356.1 Predicted ribosomal protein [Listeria grayi]
MIQVNVKRREDHVISFTMSGHADFAEHGSDLVCAGASSIAFGMVNAISEIKETEPIVEQSEGYLHYVVPVEWENDTTVQTLLTGMEHQLRSLAYSYPDHIKIYSN